MTDLATPAFQGSSADKAVDTASEPITAKSLIVFMCVWFL